MRTTQKTVWDTRLKIAGTFDKLVEEDGKIGPLDVKCTNALYPQHFVQVHGYAALLNSMGIRADTVWLLRLGTRHKAGYEMKEEPFDSRYWTEVVEPALKLREFTNDFPDGPREEKPLPTTLSLLADDHQGRELVQPGRNGRA